MNSLTRICILLVILLPVNIMVPADTGEPLVIQLMDAVTAGKPVTIKNLSLYPLKSRQDQPACSFITLEQALQDKSLAIEELNGGNVPRVSITNLSDNIVYIMGGEIITGCKQDRIIGSDLLLSPGKKNLLVPVFCVESGRWTYETGTFYSKENLGTFYMRKEAQNDNTASQGRIWNEISRMNSNLGVETSTSAYQDAYEEADIRKMITGYEEVIRSSWPDQYDITGVLAAVNERIISLDIFASHALFLQAREKLFKASIYTAIQEDNTESLSAAAVPEYLAAIRNREYIRQQGLDLGFNITAVDDSLSINGLVYEGRVIHLAAFPNDDTEEVEFIPLQRMNENDALQLNNYQHFNQYDSINGNSFNGLEYQQAETHIYW